MYSLIILVIFGISFIAAVEDRFLGCYKILDSKENLTTHLSYRNIDKCITDCAGLYYKYAFLQEQISCVCTSIKGESANDTIKCNEFCLNCSEKPMLVDLYATGIIGAGPPRNLQVENITDTSLDISWREPISFDDILSYQLNTEILHTYSNYLPNSPEYRFSNNTLRTKINVQPATKYNITLRAVSVEGPGAAVSQIVETLIGEPDNLPPQPSIIENDGTTITIKTEPVVNNNGPVTAYRIIVVNEDAKQGFQPDSLRDYYYYKAHPDEMSYYIAAELEPKDIGKTFVVGDGKTYGSYYNGPLDPGLHYNILLGIVSRWHGQVKEAYSKLSGTHNGIIFFDVNQESSDSPALIVGLSIAIGLLSFLLIAGIIGFIILKSKVMKRRIRLSENQELTLQGPMIEVENNGYIHEDDYIPVNHYRVLKQKLKTIPSNQLKVEPTNLVGVGRFGRVTSGTIYENNTMIPVLAYSIPDKKLTAEDRKSMLKELDLLVKTGKHVNVIEMLGTCESPQVVCVAFEYLTLNLKDLLLGSRDASQGRFSSMSEVQALDIAVQIAKGMTHLEQNKIIHKQLCARSILISGDNIPKISGFGLAQYHSHNKIPDYTRWTAVEVFKGQEHNPKSDVWSYACLLWEIYTLGGTPYGFVPNTNEIPDRIIKGLRLPQLQYFSDNLYQIMLQCWQVDMDERPNFSSLVELLNTLGENPLLPYISFILYSNFQYEHFYPDMELAVRPVF